MTIYQGEKAESGSDDDETREAPCTAPHVQEAGAMAGAMSTGGGMKSPALSAKARARGPSVTERRAAEEAALAVIPIRARPAAEAQVEASTGGIAMKTGMMRTLLE